MAIGFNSIRASDSWCRCRKRNYAMSIKRLFDAVERRGDIGRRIAALVLPISNRPRVTSGCAGKIGLREPGENTSGPNLASRDNAAHSQTLYTILETPPPVIPLYRKQARTYAIDGDMWLACLERWRSLAIVGQLAGMRAGLRPRPRPPAPAARPRRQRPCDSRTAEQRDDLASVQVVELHSVLHMPARRRTSNWRGSVR